MKLLTKIHHNLLIWKYWFCKLFHYNLLKFTFLHNKLSLYILVSNNANLWFYVIFCWLIKYLRNLILHDIQPLRKITKVTDQNHKFLIHPPDLLYLRLLNVYQAHFSPYAGCWHSCLKRYFKTKLSYVIYDDLSTSYTEQATYEISDLFFLYIRILDSS